MKPKAKVEKEHCTTERKPVQNVKQSRSKRIIVKQVFILDTWLENGIQHGLYIYMERNGIHIINLYKTAAKIEEAKA
jgi:ribosomal protein S2